MSNISDILQGEYESKYGNEYDLSVQKQFSKPKIYTASGNLKKRWYLYFSYRDPETKTLKRQSPIYANANRYQTKEERMAILTVYSQILFKLLKRGYNPYADNVELFKKETTKQSTDNTTETPEIKITPKVELKSEQPEEIVDKGKRIEEACAFDMTLKKQSLKESSIRSYKSHIKVFGEWMKDNHPKINFICEVDRKLVLEFLNHILTKSSARNRNNYRASLSSLYQTLEDNDIVSQNFIKNIKALKTQPKRNKTYNKELQEDIFKHMEEQDPTLLLFVKFVAYGLLRPIEICRLRVGDIDLKHKTVTFEAKNKALKTKIIPEILFQELPDLSKLNKEDSLFTPQGIGGEWDLGDDSKRNYFSKRFKKIVKDTFNLDSEHSMYSFRHTFITKLYRALVKESSPNEAKSKLMQITGHNTMDALEKYLRDIDAELPKDFSELLKS
ncbi:tyrosine-type recombinase/integrase [Aestuariibaculum sediminum]|uniref:Tyrosine-type recombinase/integrase n=2 Tax=Aestuariibaculum TaxID=1386924 RepID=A0A8J6Q9N0_9FLAO|nr:tyrosine-type recombinase/integrase [Aestuariibaculum sediminum]MBD0833765.1 tyrosine-type recombinase/integrase [Aestuariibaculum sediminum]